MLRDSGRVPAELVAFEELELLPENHEAWRAFQVLCGSRQIGMGLGPIPVSEIEAYGRMRDRPLDRLLVQKIQVIDREFMMDQAKQAPKPGKTGK